jgi:hypothetical protein
VRRDQRTHCDRAAHHGRVERISSRTATPESRRNDQCRNDQCRNNFDCSRQTCERACRLRISRSGRSLARKHRPMAVWITVSIAGSIVALSRRVTVRF